MYLFVYCFYLCIYLFVYLFIHSVYPYLLSFFSPISSHECFFPCAYDYFYASVLLNYRRLSSSLLSPIHQRFLQFPLRLLCLIFVIILRIPHHSSIFATLSLSPFFDLRNNNHHYSFIFIVIISSPPSLSRLHYLAFISITIHISSPSLPHLHQNFILFTIISSSPSSFLCLDPHSFFFLITPSSLLLPH